MLVEEGPTKDLFDAPRHRYTVGLLRCVPRGGQRKDHGRLDTIPGFLPAPGATIRGCAFADRCALADERCRAELPPLIDLGGRLSRCHYHDRAPSLPRATPAEAAGPVSRKSGEPVLGTDRLNKTFGSGAHALRVVNDVSLSLHPGETLGLVSESGSGKTTLARLLLGLIPPDSSGAIFLEGKAVAPSLEGRSAP